MMRGKAVILVLTMMLWPLYSAALTRDDFLVHTTQDLVKLCTASERDPLYQAAIGFCHGFAAGAYQYHQAITASGAGQTNFVCVPDPPPTRVEAIQMFIAWMQEHPQYLNERPVDSIFRFLATTFPCRR
jgi:hypothetical protein